MDSFDIAKAMGDFYYPMQRMELDLLAEILVPFKIAKGDLLVKEGDICKYMYYVQKGMIRQFYFKAGKDLTEHFSYEGNMIICIESFINQGPSKLLAEAIEPTIVWGIDHDGIEELALQNHKLGVFYRKIYEYSLIVSQKKADSLRFETAHEKYARLLQTDPEILKRAPLVDIASYLQMTPETLSRVRSSSL